MTNITMPYQHLLIEKQGPIATLTLNRPEALNALNLLIMEEIEDAARAFLHDEQTRVVIFKGAGKHFSAGVDLKQPPREPVPNLVMRRRDARLGGRMIRAITEIHQVTIASIQGAALGGGACITTACDFRIGAEGCFCGYPEVKLGMNLMWHSLSLCVKLIGPARAKRMIMLGEKEAAETLKEWGFLDDLVPMTTLESATLAMAGKYAARPPAVIQMIKQSINAVSTAGDDAIMHMDADQNLLTADTEDRTEGMQAFFESREPEFKGN